jgi:cell division ATPase FtsA
LTPSGEYGRWGEHAGLNILDIILEPLASSESVLYSEEKEVGGGWWISVAGTTDVRFSMRIPCVTRH